MTEREIIIRARELIETPESWCQGVNRRAANGVPVPFAEEHVSVAQRCLMGAVHDAVRQLGVAADGGNARAARRIALEIAQGYLGSEHDFWPEGTVAAWNDRPGRTHKEVLALLDAMITS